MTSVASREAEGSVVQPDDLQSVFPETVFQKLFRIDEIFSSTHQSVLAKGVKAHEQCQGP